MPAETNKKLLLDLYNAVVGGIVVGGIAVVDIFRVVDGRFSEHWDVLQEVPPASANPHTMF